ncbi:hypothetical protein HNP84_002604 [Thermocatellispora tengchongensis]|uniref:Conjugal transfer protein TraI n=2 Tax=Thermocatellispora tengchongensis TaxID=1073253 RepID=A0A840P4Q2_9ACTN|nr:hypothetical protein [Thermocatellispora tengchongensis]MBB5132883.1 hypothetical protein [Thermocatellispora tengchongensis]
MSITTPTPEPSPEDISRGLADLERHVAAHAPPAPSPRPVAPSGDTRRVQRLRAEVAEARALAALQGDDTPFLLDTVKVRRRRKAAYEAARLHELARDPAMRAWQAARMRRLLVTVAMVSLTLALAWSTAGVQRFAADGAPAWSPGWLFAWLVEPFLSLALLVVVGARAYMGTRGQPITSPALVRIEWLFLALTLGMNAWPYLPGVAEDFSLSRLVLHILGPIVAVAIVTALPIILAAFAGLDHDRDTRGLTGLTYSGNAGDPVRRTSPAENEHLARTRALIAAGELPPSPSAYKIQRALRCGMDDARAVRDALAAEAARHGGPAAGGEVA